MVKYMINAVNFLLVNLLRDTENFLSHAYFLNGMVPCPYTEDYLRMINERASDINLLSKDITKFAKEDVVERMHRVLDDIVMVHGPVESLMKLRKHHEDMGELKPNGVLDSLRKYSESLENYSEGIYDLIR